ncbi:hypothetical protein EF405_11600 [Cyclobacteriaceae bacterium YHN15]|nr:hypothetical protein EF405_11600 [Cyclobacteriaceae bacterium YHN15]
MYFYYCLIIVIEKNKNRVGPKFWAYPVFKNLFSKIIVIKSIFNRINFKFVKMYFKYLKKHYIINTYLLSVCYFSIILKKELDLN